MSDLKSDLSHFVYLKQLEKTSSKYRVRVNVLRILNNPINVELILVDEEGSRMHATIGPFFRNRFLRQITEGESRTIDTFKVLDVIGDFGISEYLHRIVFLESTIVEPCVDFRSENPNRYLKQYGDIIARPFDQRVLFDVLGEIVFAESVNTELLRGNSTRKMTFQMRNPEDRQLTINLWGSYADQVDEFVRNNPTIKVIFWGRMMCMQESDGLLDISTFKDTSIIVLNPDTPYVNAFVERLSLNQHPTYINDECMIVSNVKLRDELFGPTTPKLNITRDAKFPKVGSFVTTCTIAKLATHDWYYDACKHCSMEKTRDYCETCNFLDAGVDSRYRLVLRVTSSSGETFTIIFLDSLARYLLGKSAHDMTMANICECSSMLPTSICDLMGRRILLKLSPSIPKLQDVDKVFVVDKYTLCSTMIDEFISTFWPTQEDVDGTHDDRNKPIKKLKLSH